MQASDTKFTHEPPLSDMLADPIVQAVMASDGITRDKVEGLIHKIRCRQAEAPIEPGRIRRNPSAAAAFTNRQAPPDFQSFER